ncbi:MAG: glycerophosphodiester phosphodiesterase [Propionivibrio sp.]
MSRPAPSWELPRVVAHRCGGALAPENTLAGLPLAAALGYRAVEFDVMLSADSTPWVIHDETLERTTNGTGSVCDTPDAILRTLDAGAFQHRAFAGEPLPTFDVVARQCQALGLFANVEIKPATGFERSTGEIVARKALELWGDAPLPLVSSFSEEALAAARRVAPQLPLGYLCVRPPQDWMRRMEAVAAYSLHCAARELDDVVLADARTARIPVLCFTVNDRKAAENLLERGVSAVFSDRIDTLRGL